MFGNDGRPEQALHLTPLIFLGPNESKSVGYLALFIRRAATRTSRSLRTSSLRSSSPQRRWNVASHALRAVVAAVVDALRVHRRKPGLDTGDIAMGAVVGRQELGAVAAAPPPVLLQAKLDMALGR